MTNGQHANEVSYHDKASMPGDLTIFLSGNGFTAQRVFFLTDSNVRRHCFEIFVHELPVSPDHILVVPPGEASKSLEMVEQLSLSLAEAGCNRDSLLVNVGGGVVTDIGGFLASVYKRGIPFMNVPTSLLGMIDASIGGKTGVDAGTLKNMIGVISDPMAVMTDTSFLDTLPVDEWRNGISEMVKHALIADAGLWDELSYSSPVEFSEKERQNIKNMVSRAANVKRLIVENDKYENGDRLALNFGHTIGHAIESVMMKSDQPWAHGKAVAAGIILELIISKQTDGFPEADLRKVSAYLSKLHGLDAGLKRYADPVMDMIRYDKKQRSGGLQFCFISEVGSFRVGTLDDTQMIASALSEYTELI